MKANDYPKVLTDFGWANLSASEPRDREMLWFKTPEKHVYMWDGDGWYRVQPPERVRTIARDLPHG